MSITRKLPDGWGRSVVGGRELITKSSGPAQDSHLEEASDPDDFVDWEDEDEAKRELMFRGDEDKSVINMEDIDIEAFMDNQAQEMSTNFDSIVQAIQRGKYGR